MVLPEECNPIVTVLLHALWGLHHLSRPTDQNPGTRSGAHNTTVLSGPLLVLLRGPSGLQGIEPSFVTYKTRVSLLYCLSGSISLFLLMLIYL